LTIAGIPAEDQPLPKQQAMRFIDGLDSSMPAFHGYKLYLINSKQETDRDIYPDTLVDAIKKSILFEASWTANTQPSNLTTLPLNAFGAQGTPGDRRPRGGKTPGKGKGGGKTPGVKDKKDGTDKIGEKTKFEGECFNCGKYGHRKADCRSKAKTETKPSNNKRYIKPAQPQGEADKHV
jgi:Zinc knuckle